MIKKAAGDRAHGSVLDIGCGIGLYLERLAELSPQVHGVEFDFSRAKTAREKDLSLTSSAGEILPFPSNTFDLVLSHEVLEHVEDDRTSVEEIVRVLRAPGSEPSTPGGRFLLFVPNRGYPFETHGIFLRGKYRFGNIPLINYLPRSARDTLAPHVRVYSKRDLEKLFVHLPVRIIERKIIFGAYDNIIARWPRAGRGIRRFLHMLEATPLRFFGLSHFWVVERISSQY
jgi:SAM-dependent methyltransferase